MDTVIKSEDRLAQLGFTASAKKIKGLKDRQRKLALAYEFYKFVRPEIVDKFNTALRKKSYDWDKRGGYHVLEFVPVAAYDGVPPPEVLTEMEKAVERKCFDSYEVAYIRKVEDPLLFGCVAGCEDKFFIGQWDTDVSIDQLLKENEG